MERILINKKHVYYQVSGSNSCPSSAITMWLICQNVSGQLAAETMGTSLHRGCEANSRGSFMEMRAPEHKPWKTARNISCDGCKTAWNHFAMLMCAMWRLKCSGRARSTCEASNGKSTENIRQLGPRSYSQTPDTGSSKAPWEVPDGTECREVTQTSYRFQRTCWINHSERSKRHPDVHKPLLLSGTHRGHGLSKAPGWISRRFLPHLRTRVEKQKSCAPRRSDFNDSIRVGGQDYSAAAWSPATISGLGSC